MLISTVLLYNALISLSEAIAIKSPYPYNDISKVGTQKDLFKYLDGSAPYFSFPANTSISKDVPEGCQLTQVQLFARHGERYPSTSAGKRILKVWNKLSNYTSQFNGTLSFLNDDYTFFLNPDNFELLVSENNTLNPINPYLGSLDAEKHAEEFLDQYSDLLTKGENLTIFASSSRRVHDTAQDFIEALGDSYNVDLQILSEDPSQGANSLTPAYACGTWNESEGSEIIDQFNTNYLVDIANRINANNTGLNLTQTDAFNLFNWCAFENNVRGYSDMCNVFTMDELLKYSYYTDLESYYSDFEGCSVCRAIGSVPFNASVNLLTSNEEELHQKVWISFTHDTDLINYLSAVGLFDNGKPLTGKQMPFFEHIFRKAWIAPCGARLYTQKFSCNDNSMKQNNTQSFVRYVLNDVVIPLETCNSGPGFSCELSDFVDYAQQRMEGIDYAQQCNATEYTNQTSLTFYWDYKTKNYTAPLLLQ